MKQPTYPPLELLKRTAAKYPQAWDQMDMFHRLNGRDGLPAWEPWCYVPIGAALAVALGDKPDTFDNRMAAMRDAQRIAALAPWRQSKEVFVIDPDMQDLLFEQADDLKLDPEILLRLPYPSFYIQFSGLAPHGVFVHLEQDPEAKDRELRLLYLFPGGQTFGVPIHIDSGDLQQSIARTYEEAVRNTPEDSPEVRRLLIADAEGGARSASFYAKTLQIVLYLCAQNAEVAPSSEQAFITKRSSDGRIKDRYAEIRKWDVGVRIGSAVRAYRASSTSHTAGNRAPGTHASPRPHMRRGHWHNFWTGKKDTPDERKLVLKWVAPSFVGASQDEPPVTLHHVKGGKPDAK